MRKADIRPISDEEEARIQAAMAEDPDNPEWTPTDFANARPFAEVFPELAASLRKRGPARTKEAVSIRLDTEIVAKLRASGPGWQSRVNDALRRFVDDTA